MSKATIKTRYRPLGDAVYNVMQNGLLVRSFYDKTEATQLRNSLNSFFTKYPKAKIAK